jgi:hypothetical protein
MELGSTLNSALAPRTCFHCSTSHGRRCVIPRHQRKKWVAGVGGGVGASAEGAGIGGRVVVVGKWAVGLEVAEQAGALEGGQEAPRPS